MTSYPGSLIPLTVEIPRQETLRFLGYPAGREPPARIERLLEPALRDARGLVRARGVFLSLPPEEAPALGLELMEASALVIGLVTAGGGIEAKVGELLRKGEVLQGLLLDAAGSAAAEEAADRLGEAIAASPDRLASAAAGPGSSSARPIACRISPGYGKWGLSAQRLLFSRLPHRILGVTLLPSLLMVPRKSISFALWLGADARPLAGLAGCSVCRLDPCLYRRDPPDLQDHPRGQRADPGRSSPG